MNAWNKIRSTHDFVVNRLCEAFLFSWQRVDLHVVVQDFVGPYLHRVIIDKDFAGSALSGLLLRSFRKRTATSTGAAMSYDFNHINFSANPITLTLKYIQK